MKLHFVNLIHRIVWLVVYAFLCLSMTPSSLYLLDRMCLWKMVFYSCLLKWKCVIFKCYSSEELITLNTLHEVVPTWYCIYIYMYFGSGKWCLTDVFWKWEMVFDWCILKVGNGVWLMYIGSGKWCLTDVYWKWEMVFDWCILNVGNGVWLMYIECGKWCLTDVCWKWEMVFDWCVFKVGNGVWLMCI